MAVARVQSKMASGSSLSATNTPTAATAAGSLLVFAVACAGGATAATPSGWTLALGPISGGPNLHLFYRANAPSLTSVTASLSSSVRWETTLLEYSGFGTLAPTVLTAQFATNNLASSPLSVGPVSPAGNAALVCAISNSGGATTLSSPTGGFAIGGQLANGVANALAWLEEISPAGGTYTAGVNAPTTNGYSAALASFVPGVAFTGNLPLLMPALGGGAGLQSLDGGLFS